MFLLISTLLWANPQDPPQPPTEDDPNTSDTQEETSSPKEESSNISNEENTPSETVEEAEDTAPSQEELATIEQSEQEKTLSDLILLLNEATPIEQRITLLNELHLAPNVLPALQTLSLHGPISIRKEMLTLLKEHPEDPVTYNIASSTLSANANEDIKETTYVLLKTLKTPQAAQILKERAESKNVSSKERKRARTLLENHYPKFLAKNPPRILTADPFARAIFSTGSAVLGGNLFATLGRLSQGDDGAALGGTTGSLAGGVGGYLYTQDKSFTHGSAWYFIHANTWGSILGSGLAERMSLDDNLYSIMRSVGSLGGAMYGIHTLSKERSVDDVLESNLIIGQSTYLSSALFALSGLTYGESDLDSILFGSAVGFGLAEFISPHWKPDLGTALLASVYGGEAALLASSLDDEGYAVDGLGQFMVSAAIIAAEVQDHFQKPKPHVIATSIYGAYTGHIFGNGVSNLQSSYSSLPISIGGAVGTIAGSYIGTKSPYFDSSFLLGSSVLVAANTFGLYGIVDALQSESSTNGTLSGIRDISTGLGNMGMLYAQDKFNLTGERTLFLTSTSLWGSYFALTGTAIIGTEPSQLGGSMLLLSSFDIGLGAGAYLLSRPNFQIRDSINPQLFAIIGASLGTFGAYLINNSARSLAIGSLVGTGLGGYMGTKYSIDLPKTDFFDKLFISAVPQFSQEGDLGVQMQIGGLLGD